MIIKNIFAPRVAGEHTAEEIIFRRGVGELFVELREVLTATQLLITNTPRGRGHAPLPGLPNRLNRAIGESLTSLGWRPRQAPGSPRPQSTTDWTKVRPSGITFMGDIGIAVEVQFGNHYQFNADVQRFAEAILQGQIIAGISVVASDELRRFKADRGAHFSDAKTKLERWLGIWAGSGAILIPSIMVIGIEHDGFLDSVEPGFSITYPIYDLSQSKNEVKPIRFETMASTPGEPAEMEEPDADTAEPDS